MSDSATVEERLAYQTGWRAWVVDRLLAVAVWAARSATRLDSRQTFGVWERRSGVAGPSAATAESRLGWQPYAWLVVRIPYHDRDHAERDELDAEVVDRAEALIRDLDIDGGEAKLLDHVGISEWMYEVIANGLRA